MLKNWFNRISRGFAVLLSLTLAVFGFNQSAVALIDLGDALSTIDGAQSDVLTLGAAIFGVLIAAAVFRWARRVL